MTSEEFARWIAYANVEPFGYPMENYRMGVPAAAIYNAVIATIALPKGARRPKQLKASDLYPIDKRPPELTPEQRDHIRRKREHGKRRHRHS